MGDTSAFTRPVTGMSDSNTTLPNPDTPLAFFSPEEAYQTSVSIYVDVGALAVCFLDVDESKVS